MASHSRENSGDLVHKLVANIIQKGDAVEAVYKNVLQVLNYSYDNYDSEFSMCDKIKKKLMKENRVEDSLKFVELHRKLQTSAILKNRDLVLNFLYCLQGAESENLGQFFSDIAKLSSLDQDITLNSHDIIQKSHSSTVELGDLLTKAQNRKSSADPQFTLSKSCSSKEGNYVHNRVASLFPTNYEKQFAPHSRIKCDYKREKALTTTSDELNLGSIPLTVPNMKPLLKDILYAMQGLKGNIISWDPDNKDFNVVFKQDFPNPVKRLTLRFIELGRMYCLINQYSKAKSNEKSLDLIAQSFVEALNSSLVSYYKLIAELEALLTQEVTLEKLYDNSNSLTLHRLSVWFFEPHLQLKILASVVNACKGKKGGALASVLYSHLHHSDISVRTLIQNLFKVVTRPLIKMLSNWIYSGELIDEYEEFFVAINIAVPDCSLWQEKYSLNKGMIPSFITMEQARKILSCGKAIIFLRQVCQETTFVRDENRRKALELMSTESLFSEEKDGNFENILEKNYTRTSKTVLQVLHEKYNLMDHLWAMRNYFLLGQGDFIRHLMDLLDNDLEKPANSLYIHNLSGILESAILYTNAQFHNPEVLKRLDVRLLEVSAGDSGWDVFTLDYHADGPIGTLFTPHCMNSYLRLFTTLWRAKRMEYILSKIYRSRTTYLKLQEKVPEVTPVLYQCHLTLSQMVHFVHQLHYYMAFEVMECCWADLLLKISSAQDLDQVIAAHENFLDTLLTRALLDEESLILRAQLKAIYELIINFDKIQFSFWNEVKSIVEKLDKLDEQAQNNTNRDQWGVTEKQKRDYEVHLELLKTKSIPSSKAQLKVLSNSYENMVQKFLLMLNDKNDPNLECFSLRLDFNEYFRRQNSRLQASLTYQHRKKSKQKPFFTFAN